MHTERLAAVLTVVLATSFVGCASPSIAPPPAMAQNLKAPSDQTLSLATNARGVQIYECSRSKADPALLEWVFKAPEAELTDGAGKKLGTHYAGPTWEANDGSKVVAEVKARDDGPDSNAIPWLLLAAKSNSRTGAFGRTRLIQRVNTVGGKAPAAACERAGQELRVPYTAVYYFYSPR
jgi:Protein of unknown function (DUF3455)